MITKQHESAKPKSKIPKWAKDLASKTKSKIKKGIVGGIVTGVIAGGLVSWYLTKNYEAKIDSLYKTLNNTSGTTLKLYDENQRLLYPQVEETKPCLTLDELRNSEVFWRTSADGRTVLPEEKQFGTFYDKGNGVIESSLAGKEISNYLGGKDWCPIIVFDSDNNGSIDTLVSGETKDKKIIFNNAPKEPNHKKGYVGIVVKNADGVTYVASERNEKVQFGTFPTLKKDAKAPAANEEIAHEAPLPESENLVSETPQLPPPVAVETHEIPYCGDLKLTVSPSIGSDYTKKGSEIHGLRISGINTSIFNAPENYGVNLYKTDSGKIVEFKKEISCFTISRSDTDESLKDYKCKSAFPTYTGDAVEFKDTWVPIWHNDKSTFIPHSEYITNVKGVKLSVAPFYLSNANLFYLGLDNADTGYTATLKTPQTEQINCGTIIAHRSWAEKIANAAADTAILYIGGKIIFGAGGAGGGAAATGGNGGVVGGDPVDSVVILK